MQLKFAVPLGLVLLCAGAVASAHHSPSMFDPAQRKTLAGTVREFQWTNPHCYVQLLVKNAKGVDEEWSLEMGAPTYLYAKGWRPSTLKPGDQISVTVAPLRKGGNGGMLLLATSLDGKPLGKSTANSPAKTSNSPGGSPSSSISSSPANSSGNSSGNAPGKKP